MRGGVRRRSTLRAVARARYILLVRVRARGCGRKGASVSRRPGRERRIRADRRVFRSGVEGGGDGAVTREGSNEDDPPASRSVCFVEVDVGLLQNLKEFGSEVGAPVCSRAMLRSSRTA